MNESSIYAGAYWFAGISSFIFVYCCARDLFRKSKTMAYRALTFSKWFALDLIATNIAILIVGYNACLFIGVDSTGCGGFAGFASFYLFPIKLSIWFVVPIPLRVFRNVLLK